jgi:hypothetical protein
MNSARRRSELEGEADIISVPESYHRGTGRRAAKRIAVSQFLWAGLIRPGSSSTGNLVRSLKPLFPMKPSMLLVAGSLVLNAALAIVYFSRSSSELASSTPTAVGSSTDANAPTGFWATLDADDLSTFARNLRLAGFSPAMVREIVEVRAEALAKIRAEAEAVALADTPFWKPIPSNLTGGDLSAFMFEPGRLVRDALGPDPARETRLRRQLPLGDLPPAKAEAIARINRDYRELREHLEEESQGITLPGDAEKAAMLQGNERADIVAALTPAELEIYDMSRSMLTRSVTHSLSLMNGTEDEFVRIFRVYHPFAEILDPVVRPLDFAQQRAETELLISEKLKAALGESRYAEYVRASDSEFQDLDRITAHADLPREVAHQVFDLRRTFTEQSKRVFDDPTQTVPQKRAALRTLALNANTQIGSLLGPKASEAYLRAIGWLRQIESGNAVTYDSKGRLTIWNLPNATSTQGPAEQIPR